MHVFAPYLDALGGQSRGMADLVAQWVAIRSGSYDVEGLSRMAEALKGPFAALGGEVEEIHLAPHRNINSLGHPVDVPLGKALRFRKRPGAPVQVFLGIHYDVVYGDGDGPGPPEVRVEGDVLRGSGSVDAKGGLVILLKALETLEASPYAAGLGWEVLLNPDEEIGSPGSLPLLREAAGRNHLGLLFEPCLPDGNLVSIRKGSGNFTAVMRGRASHAGRDPHLGRNAVSALAEFVVDLDRFGRTQPGMAVNVGKLEGGGPVNRVPDLALGRFNLRVRSAEDQVEAEAYLKRMVEEFNRRDGFSLEIHGGFSSPPKVPAGPTLGLQRMVTACGKDLGLDLKWESSGGVSDGNKLAAAGLPNVDTLGAQGGNIHSGEEFLRLDSLLERARLAALLLFKLATGEMAWPPPAPEPNTRVLPEVLYTARRAGAGKLTRVVSGSKVEGAGGGTRGNLGLGISNGNGNGNKNVNDKKGGETHG
ncbi:MAG TPA: hydrolase [Fibrobacteria bacterium]|nr:hydrolase [Fibrobacteria bacterium]